MGATEQARARRVNVLVAAASVAVIAVSLVVLLAGSAVAAGAAGSTPGPSHAAAHSIRWGLLIGVGIDALVVLAVAAVGRASTLILGQDHRISTSKTVAAVWTLVVAAVLIALVYANLLNHPQGLNATNASGVIGQYAVLFGGPLGAAILAKQIVTTQLAKNPSAKPPGTPALRDLVANDVGDADLGDFQYVLFNSVALFYVVSTLLHSPLKGLPHIPDVLLGLTSVSAVGYLGKKAVTPAGGATGTAAARAAMQSTPHTAPGTVPTPPKPQNTLGTTIAAAGSASDDAPSLPRTAAAVAAPRATAVRSPNSLPDPSRPAGQADAAMPFDHIIVVMMENHSFDNLLGELPRHGQPAADGLNFDASGQATNWNPDAGGGRVTAFPFPSTAQGTHVSQSWNSTHEQVNAGGMDGFVQTAGGEHQPMGYYPPDVLPFAYSLATEFTLANRWFSSVPAPTYPNRRFLMAGTAYGDITTALNTLSLSGPPNGTIFDQLHAHGVSWRDYFTDIPQTALIPSTIEKYVSHHVLIDQFFEDCRTGNLPAVSFVDPEMGLLSEMGKVLESLPLLKTLLDWLGVQPHKFGGSEEDPQDMYYGEKWAHEVISAVLKSPAWPRTLLIYTYDEHGGYFDHVVPPPAIAPDMIPPALGAADMPGGYDIYGPRVPAVVVSPYSRPNAVTDLIHDHTSVLATIEAKWNLPALSYRDANANTVMDFLDTTRPALLSPPTITGPSDTGPSGPSQ